MDSAEQSALSIETKEALPTMKKFAFLAAAALAATLPTVASAQETAPDGSPAFGFEPYVAVTGGYNSYDRDAYGVPAYGNGGRYEGAFIEGALGANIPLGPIVAGVEGNVAKGINGDIDWRYGVAGRLGVRAGDSGLVYGKAGYEWTNFNRGAASVTGGDFGQEVYGLGVEVGPRDIGLGGVSTNSGVRIRLEANTSDFQTIRPQAGVVFHF